MKKSTFVFLCLLTLAGCLPAQEIVWPGDANNNGVCNNVDVLYLAQGIFTQGPPRNTPSTGWQASQAPSWNNSTIDGVNYAHLDCSGNGLIDSTDFSAIDLNYGLTNGPIIPDIVSPNSSNAPLLQLLTPADSLSFSNTTTFVIDIALGDTINPASNISGIAFSVIYDTNFIDTVAPAIPGGFIAQQSPVLNDARDLGGRIDFVVSRTGLNTTTGFGLIGSIGIVMDDNLRVSQDFNLNFQIVDVAVMDGTGIAVPIQAKDTTMWIEALTAVGLSEAVNDQVQVYPNPSQGNFHMVHPEGIQDFQVLNTLGEVVFEGNAEGERAWQVDVRGLPAGHYFLRGFSGNGVFRRVLSLQ